MCKNQTNKHKKTLITMCPECDCKYYVKFRRIKLILKEKIHCVISYLVRQVCVSLTAAMIYENIISRLEISVQQVGDELSRENEKLRFYFRSLCQFELHIFLCRFSNCKIVKHSSATS